MREASAKPISCSLHPWRPQKADFETTVIYSFEETLVYHFLIYYYPRNGIAVLLPSQMQKLSLQLSQ